MAGLTPAPKLDINALLEAYGSPTQHRTNYVTNCPLHEDNTPSCSVNSEKQVWSCKSCGEGGDGYTLIMRKEQVDFRGAVERGAALGVATGGTGGGGGDVRGSRYGGRRTAQRKGNHQGNGKYVPPWRSH